MYCLLIRLKLHTFTDLLYYVEASSNFVEVNDFVGG